MNMQECEHVKDLSYWEYCDYLQDKYGIGKAPYMTDNWNPSAKCKRAKEGLFAHHKAEVYVPLLSKKEQARLFPFEWQEPEWVVYCDYLEHLLLHIMICKNPEPLKDKYEVGIGGVVNYIAPMIFQLYAGSVFEQAWQATCFDRIKNDKKVYLELLKMFFTLYCTSTSHSLSWRNSLWHISAHGYSFSRKLETQRQELKLTEEVLKYLLPYDEDFFTYLSSVFDHTESYESLVTKRDSMINLYLSRNPSVDRAWVWDIPENLSDFIRDNARVDSIAKQLRSIVNKGIRGERLCRNGWSAYMYSPEIVISSGKLCANVEEAKQVCPEFSLWWYERFKKGLLVE